MIAQADFDTDYETDDDADDDDDDADDDADDDDNYEVPPAPDIEEPEDGFVPEPDSSPKRSEPKEAPSPKKKRTKTTEIQLENPPQDEVDF